MFAVKKPPQAAAHSGVFCLRTDVLENLSCLRKDQTFAKLGDLLRKIYPTWNGNTGVFRDKEIYWWNEEWLWMVDALENFEYPWWYMFHKTVGSHSPDEKYNLLAGEGGVGSWASGAAVTGGWWRQVLILLILILWRRGFHPAGHVNLC